MLEHEDEVKESDRDEKEDKCDKLCYGLILWNILFAKNNNKC